VKLDSALLAVVILLGALPVRADTGRNDLSKSSQGGLRAGAAVSHDAAGEWANPGSGMLLLEGEGDEPWLAPQVSTEVQLVVTGMIARAQVEQVFENPSEEPVEAVYVFPLPEGAAVDGLTLQIGDRKIVGQIREREEAVREFERAAEAGKKASLVSQERPNLFTSTVSNIAPGEVVRVRLSYQEDVRYDHGAFSLAFPSTFTPRYNPGQPPLEQRAQTSASKRPLAGNAVVAGDDAAEAGRLPSRVADAARITPPVLLDGSGPFFDVHVTLDAGFELEQIESPSHELEVSRERGVARVHVKDGPVLADRDFLLHWRPVASDAPRSATFTEEFGGERYAMLMLLPPSDHAGEAAHLRRDTTFVVDTSGSMAGTSIAQAIASLRTGLAALDPSDRFNVIEFNSTARRLFDRSRYATAENVKSALDWVNALQADGGTEIQTALELALSATGDASSVEQLVFITDGSVGNEDELFGFIQKHLGARRLFTVGIGSAPNGYFMRGAARFGRGTFTLVNSLDEVSARMDELWAKLDAPAMRDVGVDFPASSAELWPERSPDLYLGEPLVLVAKLGAGARSARVTGNLAGQAFTRELSLDHAAHGSGIHRIWARRKIEAVMDQAILGRDESVIRGEVLPIALEHHLVSKYTSLVAVDSQRSTAGRSPRASVASALPAGNEMFGNMPQTATPGPFCLLFGVFSFAAAAVVQRRVIL
jgi:Ca-activated chloride channel family protein